MKKWRIIIWAKIWRKYINMNGPFRLLHLSNLCCMQNSVSKGSDPVMSMGMATFNHSGEKWQFLWKIWTIRIFERKILSIETLRFAVGLMMWSLRTCKVRHFSEISLKNRHVSGVLKTCHFFKMLSFQDN